MYKDENYINIDTILQILWALGFAIALFLIFTILQNGITNSAPLIGAFAILISAGIASASVMKNITVTRENEERKHKKEESKFYLDKSIKTLSNVHDLLGDKQDDIFTWREASSLLLSVKELFKNITDKSHIQIFKQEYSEYSSKLFRSFIRDKNEAYSPLTPTFFCWNKNRDRDLNIVFDESEIHISPKFILPVIDFAETFDNDFLTNSLDYEEWRSFNLNRPKHSLLNVCAIDFINLYKEKYPENKEKNA